METITFYSYKGGTGRSLALANAAWYLARLGRKVVALDFDLEAPGLPYKFCLDPDGKALAVQAGVVDYIYSFMEDGGASRPIKEFALEVNVPSAAKPITLIPAGRVPSVDYWFKLSQINWHALFYSPHASGVQILLEFKNRILDELDPDFLLVDSRTGITEMGGVATALFADRVICLVSPAMESLEGSRAVLRSLKRSRRESGAADIEIKVALSRLPEMKSSEDERGLIGHIQSVMNEEADDLRDTLACQHVFVLHSEPALQVREALRVGSGISPDESVLLRDYLRLFASVVPWEAIEPDVHGLLQQAREKILDDPDGAVKEVEELAESYGRPEIYRDLLRFYNVRNLGASLILKRAQQLWDISGNSDDPALWQAVSKAFKPLRGYEREKVWYPNLDFISAVWRGAGKRDPDFGMKLAWAYDYEDLDSLGADVLLEIIETSGITREVASRCITMLDYAKRGKEADELITEHKAALADAREFLEAWARHALRSNRREALVEFTQAPLVGKLKDLPPHLVIRIYYRSGLKEQAAAYADAALREVSEGRLVEGVLTELGEVFVEMDRWDEFEQLVDRQYPDHVLETLRSRLGPRRRRG
jgi:MinD-like ATPase involved in chromosome partitioning or flagellar assembly